MKDIFKKMIPFLPLSITRLVFSCYEGYFELLCRVRDKKFFAGAYPIQKNKKLRILFYQLSGLCFGGTEKFLQIIAKHIDKEKNEIYFMYSKTKGEGRKPYLENQNVTFISFEQDMRETTYPFYIKKMSPLLSEIVRQNNIDLIITAGSGYSEYPINTIKHIPIIMLNIFGSPSMQKNIVKHIAISKEVKKKIIPLIPEEKTEVMYIPVEQPPTSSASTGQALRETMGFSNDDFVFGRIGRNSNDIFDPIGIEAFKIVVAKYPHTKYLIQSPPPILVEKVKRENIPNVYFLEPTSDEEKIWAFHFAIDALAHFRLDGESCGLNIIEAMTAGKPIISHKSSIWNAHLEYLDPAFSLIAEKDNIEQYAAHMNRMIEAKKNGSISLMNTAATNKAVELFLIKNNIARFESWIKNIVPAS